MRQIDKRKHSPVEPTIPTQIKIIELIIADYEEQLRIHKTRKSTMDYAEYRYIYVRLHNDIQWRKAKLKQLQNS